MVFDRLGQQGVFLLLALVPALTFVIALSWREPPPPAAPRDGHRARLADTFRRPGIRLLLALAFIYGGAHAGGLGVSKIFLVDQGWSNPDTGLVATFSGFVMLVLGCPAGSALTARNRWRAMAAGMALAAASFVVWGLVAGGVLPAGRSWILLAISILPVASGFIAVSAATIIMAFGGGLASGGCRRRGIPDDDGRARLADRQFRHTRTADEIEKCPDLFQIHGFPQGTTEPAPAAAANPPVRLGKPYTALRLMGADKL